MATSPYPVFVSAHSGITGGAEVFSLHLVRGLRARGIPARVLLTAPSARVSWQENFPSDVPVETLAVSPLAGWRARCKALISRLEAAAPCVYLPNYDWMHALVSPCLSNRVGIVGVMHSDDPSYYQHAIRLGRYWNALVAVSPAVARETTRVLPERASRISTIPYGLPAPPMRRSQSRGDGKPLRLVYHGRLVQEQKRIFDLVAVMETAAAAGLPVEFTIIGDGTDASAVRQRCKALVEGGKVSFVGHLPNAEAVRVLEDTDVFLLTSEFEGLPLSLLEAMGRGCVPIVTAVRSGIPELINDGVNGFGVPIGDVAGMVDRIARLAGSESERRKIGEAARATATAAPYRLDDMVASYAELFDGVMAEATVGGYRRPAGVLERHPSVRWWHSLPAPIRTIARNTRAGLRWMVAKAAAGVRISRGREWWAPKIAPLLAVACLQLLLHRVTPSTAYLTLAGLLAGLTALAAFGHTVNDLFDIVADRLAGKPNGMAGLSSVTRVLVVVGLAAGGLVPWLLVPLTTAAWGAWVSIYLLLIIYSAPPTRTKERGLAGVLTDAAMAHATPTLFVCLLFAGPLPLSNTEAWPVTVTLVLWAGAAGIRNILLGQLWDHENDLRSGVVTFTTERGTRRVKWLARRAVFPVELLALLLVVLVARPQVPWLAWAVPSALLLDYAIVHWVGRASYDPAPEAGKWVALHNVYQAWLPLMLSVGLAIHDWRFVPLSGFLIVLFGKDLRVRTGVGVLSGGYAAVRRRMHGRSVGRVEPCVVTAPQPTVHYVICATQRSGSNLLCEALWNTGRLGRPAEYFMPWCALARNPGLAESSRQAAWNIPPGEFVEKVVGFGTTPNGVCGVTLMQSYVGEVLGMLRGIPVLRNVRDARMLPTLWPTVRYIYITRRDKVRQAVSMARAIQSGQWMDVDRSHLLGRVQELEQWFRDLPGKQALHASPQRRPRPSYYDAGQLAALYHGFLEQEEAWAYHFLAAGVHPLRVVYEDLAQSPHATALAVASYLGVEGVADRERGFGAMRRQSDALSDEWAQRLAEELGVLA